MPAGELLRHKIKMNCLPPEMTEQTLIIADEACKRNDQEKDVANFIKRQMDARYGSTWHCIAGRAFGAWVHHENFRFIWLYMDKFGILIYKSA